MTKWHAVLCFVAIFSGSALAIQCSAPHYNRGKVYVNSSTEIVMQISVQPSDLGPAKLSCLAADLRRHHRGARKILVTIYDSLEAAKVDRPLTVEASPNDFLRFGHMHAAYTYDAEKGQDFVTIYPDPRRKDLATKVDLSSMVPNYSCTLQVSDRCLIALGHIEYPREEKKNNEAGTVTLSGIIGRDGKLNDVRATKTDANPALVDYSIQNLRTWRFEPGENDIALLLTYSFQLVNSPVFENGSKVQISLPDRVIVTDNPVH